jgi:hypothetical protein
VENQIIEERLKDIFIAVNLKNTNRVAVRVSL